MRIVEMEARTPELVERLVAVWEGSVAATHHFLSERARSQIRRYVPRAIRAVPVLVVAEDEQPLGFMGISGERLEMLFVAAVHRGAGIGRRLLEYGMERFAVRELAVNEQNLLARGFYEHMGYEVYRRTELDEQGNPHPLLYMRRRLGGTGESAYGSGGDSLSSESPGGRNDDD